MPSLLSPAANIGIILLSLLSIIITSQLIKWLRVREDGHTRAVDRIPVLEDPSSSETLEFPSIFGPARKYISLIMPAYNEEARLPGTLDETLSYLQDRARQDKTFTYEIIVVDDGSTDDTVKVAFEYVKRVTLDVLRVIKLGSNHGKGAAVRKGMLCSRGQLLLMLDADGATKITDLEKLESEMKRMMISRNSSTTTAFSPERMGQVPVTAFGSRAYLEKQALATRKWYRNVLMKGFHLFVLLVAGPGVKDTQCGFKLFTRSAARQLFLNLRLERFSFDVELVYLCKRLHIPILEVAVTWTEIPGSKVRPLSMVHMALELVLLRLGYGLQFWKIHQRSAED
ncbi:unnamed protein product [Calypogeia fissa]